MRMKFDKGLFVVKCPKEERFRARSAGFTYDKQGEVWVTKDSFIAGKLIDVATAKARKELETRKKELAASSATDSKMKFPKPDGLEYMPFQKAGIAYMAGRDSCLCSDQMGTGKTIQAIGLINLKDLKNVLIVCPKSVKINWQRELDKWLVTKRKIAIIDYGQPNLSLYDIVIINYDQLVKWENKLQERKWDILIADESHKLKNAKAKWSKSMKKVIGMADIKLFLTGTPILNRPIELLNQLVLLGSEIGGNWFKFVTRYCRAYKDRFGWQVKGSSNLEELQTRLRTEIMIRRLKVDVLKDLPPKVRQIIELTGKYDVQVNNEKEARKSYLANKREVKKEMRRWDGANEAKYKDAVKRLQGIEQVAITEMSTLRHETAKAKLPETLIHIEEAMENESKILVFAHHRDIIEEIHKKYRKTSVVIYGGTSQNNRQRAIDGFQTDKSIRLFIGSITAAGLGITLTAASTVIFAELDWTPANITQCEDRAYRLGQRKMVLVQHIVVPSSIDAKMAKMLIRKQEVIDRATNKDRLETPNYSEQMEEAVWAGK